MAKENIKPKYEKGVRDRSKKNHIVDIILLVLILAVVGVGIFIGVRNRKVKTLSQDTIHYVLFFENVDSIFKNAITANQDLYLSGDSLNMGRVVRVESVENYSEIIYDDVTGAAVIQKYPENTRVNITIVVEATVDNRALGYYLEDVRVAIGAKYDLFTPTFAGTAECIGFSD